MPKKTDETPVTPAEETPAPLPSFNLEDMAALDDILGEAAARQAQTMDFGDGTEDTEKMDYIAVPQDNSKSYPMGRRAGFIFVGHKNEAKQPEGWYFKELLYLPVTNLLYSPEGKKFMIGGRLQWELLPGGARNLEKPAMCYSKNGMYPDPFFIGKAVKDAWTQEEHYIGFDKQVVGGTLHLTPKNPLLICATCPFSQFNENGRKFQCNKNWTWLVWVPTQTDVDGKVMPAHMAWLRGANLSVQFALEGRAKGATGAQKDGKPFPGVNSFTVPGTPFRTAVHVSEWDNLRADQKARVVGLTNQPEKAALETAAGMVFVAPHDEARWATLTKAYEYAVLEVKTYPFAPEGLPSDTGTDTPVYPIKITPVENNMKNTGIAPLMELQEERRLTLTEYRDFYMDFKTGQDVRKDWLGSIEPGAMNVQQRQMAYLDQQQRQIAGPVVSGQAAAASLPGGSGETVADDEL